MDWGWNEEQEMLRRSLAEFVRTEITPNVLAWEQAGEVPRSLFTKLADLGVLGLRLSPELGGGGHDFWFTRSAKRSAARSRIAGRVAPSPSWIWAGMFGG